jgi:hypothetical protein
MLKRQERDLSSSRCDLRCPGAEGKLQSSTYDETKVDKHSEQMFDLVGRVHLRKQRVHDVFDRSNDTMENRQMQRTMSLSAR